jgi:hypothetical protein
MGIVKSKNQSIIRSWLEIFLAVALGNLLLTASFLMQPDSARNLGFVTA